MEQIIHSIYAYFMLYCMWNTALVYGIFVFEEVVGSKDIHFTYMIKFKCLYMNIHFNELESVL